MGKADGAWKGVERRWGATKLSKTGISSDQTSETCLGSGGWEMDVVTRADVQT